MHHIDDSEQMIVPTENSIRMVLSLLTMPHELRRRCLRTLGPHDRAWGGRGPRFLYPRPALSQVWDDAFSSTGRTRKPTRHKSFGSKALWQIHYELVPAVFKKLNTWGSFNNAGLLKIFKFGAPRLPNPVVTQHLHLFNIFNNIPTPAWHVICCTIP